MIDKNNVEIGIAFYSQNQFSIIGVFKLKIIRLMNHFGIIDNVLPRIGSVSEQNELMI